MEKKFIQRYAYLQNTLKLKVIDFTYSNFFFWVSDIDNNYTSNKSLLFEFANKQIHIIKLFSFFSRLSLADFLVYRIFFYNHYSKWVLLNYCFNSKSYKKVVKQILENYYTIFHDTEVINKNKLILFPSNFLLNYTINSTSELKLNYSNIQASKYWFNDTKQLDHSESSYGRLNISFLGNMKELFSSDTLNYSSNLFKLHFIRVQRRYNKRRYSKVRAYSRPSFFAGITLSNLLLACLWGGTMMGCDWQSPFIINVDINLILLAIMLYTINKLLRFSYWSNFLALWSRSKFAYKLGKMLDLHLYRRIVW